MSLRYAVLAVLAAGEPATGYEITKKVDGSVGFFWGATHQQIYRELAEMEKEGLLSFEAIKQDGKPDKKVYELTLEGEQSLSTWIKQPMEPNQSKDTLLVKVFAGKMVPSSVLREEVLRHQKIHRERLEVYREICAQYFSNPKKLKRPQLFKYLTLRRGIIYEEGWLDWCREALETISDAP